MVCPTQKVTYVIRGSSSPPQESHPTKRTRATFPHTNVTTTCVRVWVRTIHSPAPVRGLTLPSTPLPFHRSPETRSQTFSPRAMVLFFFFSIRQDILYSMTHMLSANIFLPNKSQPFSIVWVDDTHSICDLPCLLTYLDNFASKRHKADATRSPVTNRSLQLT